MSATLRERLTALADQYARQIVTPLYGPDATPTPYERGTLRWTRTHFLAGAQAALRLVGSAADGMPAGYDEEVE